MMRQLKITQQITSRDSRAVENYLQDINQFEMVTPEEESELARKIRTGDEKALERLIKANLRFVVSVSKKYQYMGLSLADLISQGNVGLIKAARRFDETKGFKFISYAVWWIRQSILQALSQQPRLIRLPLNQVSAVQKLARVYSKLVQELEREPNEVELSLAMEMPRNQLNETLAASDPQLSLDKPLRDDESVSMGDLIANFDSPGTDKQMIDESLRNELVRSLSLLSKQEREVIRLYYGLGMEDGLTLGEIGLKFRISKERVRQIREMALRRLRVVIPWNQFREYLYK